MANYKQLKLDGKYKPKASEKYMSTEQKAYFYRLLNAQLEEYQAQTENSISNVQVAEKEQDVGDESDTANLELDAENKMKQAARANNYIKKIEFALHRLEEGSYGYSVLSGDEIGLKRLLARPVATMTAEEQEEYEKKSR